MAINMNRGVYLIGLLMLSLGLLCGCGAQIPDLTSEETELISEYAAGILLKYDKKSNTRLVELDENDLIYEKTVEEVMQEPEPATESDALYDEVTNLDENKDGITYSTRGLNEIIGVNNISLYYQGYDIADTYPMDHPNAYYACDASAGKTFLILNIGASNSGSESVELALNQLEIKYEIMLNENENVQVLATLSPNDIHYYKKVLESGQTDLLVLIAEISKEVAESIDTISLSITKDDMTEYILCE